MTVEPQENRMEYDDQLDARPRCLNCGEVVLGRYCHHCGQHVGEHNKGVWPFIQEFLEEFIRLDSKFLRTLVPLFLKPGFLTREWVAGKRVRYITPLKLYVSLSALCFLAISLTSSRDLIRVDSTPPKMPAVAQKAIEEDAKQPKTSFERMIEKPFQKLKFDGPDGAANVKEFGDKFIGRLSTANLILLPIFALLFKLLYIRRSRFYVEHLVFALHYYGFFSIGTTLVIFFSKVVHVPLVNVAIVLWMLAYLPVAMFVNYRQGIIKTFIKCWIFCSFYLVAIAFILLALVLVTALEIGLAQPDRAAVTPAASKSIPPNSANTR